MNYFHTLTLFKGCRLWLPIIGFLISSTSLVAQLNIGGTPQSFSQPALTDFVPDVITPAIDLAALQLEDAERDNLNVPYRFAVGFKVDHAMTNTGTWEDLSNGDRIWKLKVLCPSALTTNFIFNDFYLPPGGVLYIYNESRSHVLGGYTAQNNRDSRTFATELLDGEIAILEYYEPAAVVGQGVIQLGQIAHGYRGTLGNEEKNVDNQNPEEKSLGDSGACQVNINCSEGSSWQTIKKSVAAIIVNGTGTCTGTLMNTTDPNSCTPYFLTADHCIDGTYDAIGTANANIVFYWNYEYTGCANTGAVDQTQTTSGAVVVANDDDTASSDFALLRLKESPIGVHDVYLSGWDATGATGTAGGVGIHHPRFDAKKVATYSGTPTVGTPKYWRTAWDMTANGYSVPEGGSSGSGMFNGDGILIGQLFGAFGNNLQFCANPSNDYADYGQLSYAWTNNGATDIRRKVNTWLDPIGGGTTMSAPGRYPSSIPCAIRGGCTNPRWITCEEKTAVNTTSNSNNFSSYGSETGWVGKEYIFSFTAITSGQTSFKIANATLDYGIFLYSSACNPSTSLLAHVDDVNPIVSPVAEELIYNVTAGTTYYIAIDSKNVANGQFTLEVLCRSSCYPSEFTFCGNTISSTTVGAYTSITRYSGLFFSHTGPERVYAVHLLSGNVTITLNIANGQDLDLLLMSACDPSLPIIASSTTNTATETITHNVTSGLYYISVDGFQGATSPFTLNVSCATPTKVLDTKVFLQGSLNTGTSMMNTALGTGNLVPLVEPYTGLNYVYNTAFRAVTTPSIISANNIVDWVIVELRTGGSPAAATSATWSQAALLTRDGKIVDHRDGTSPISFLAPATTPTYIVVKHRNHLGIMTNIRY